MTKTEAIEQVIAQSERENVVLSSQEIVTRAILLLEDAATLNAKRREFDSLSSKNSGSRVMRPITTLNALTQPVLRDLVCSSAAEFLGEEFWMSLNTQSERLAVKRTFEFMRSKITRGMC